MTNPENFGQQFASIISANYSKCPGCNRNYVTDSSPVSTVNNKTKICDTCSAGELGRAAIKNVDPSSFLDNSGSVADLSDSFINARTVERAVDKAQSESSFHGMRIKNSDVPIPESTKVKNWQVDYDRNQHTGAIEAHAATPTSNSHYARLNHETGEVSFGAYGTNTPPEYVAKHIKGVLTKHFLKHVKGQ